MTKLAQLISKMEGYGKPDAIPTIRHNPGDLRHSPHSSHSEIGANDIGIIDSDSDGWADLERQLNLYAERGLTVEQAIHEFAPPNENNTAGYLAFVVQGLGLPAGTPLKDALGIKA